MAAAQSDVAVAQQPVRLQGCAVAGTGDGRAVGLRPRQGGDPGSFPREYHGAPQQAMLAVIVAGFASAGSAWCHDSDPSWRCRVPPHLGIKGFDAAGR